MELKKVGYCYASINQLKLTLDNYFNEYQDNYFYIFNVKTNKGVNFQVVVKRDKINFDFNCIVQLNKENNDLEVTKIPLKKVKEHLKTLISFPNKDLDIKNKLLE